MSKSHKPIKTRFTAVICSKVTDLWRSEPIYAINLKDAEEKAKKLYPEDEFWIGDVHEGL